MDSTSKPTLNADVTKPIKLPKMGGLPDSWHQFQKNDIHAINTAMHIQRPLLIRGEPGLGKSQIAHAIAACMEWNLLVHVVHARTEPSDLLYRIDHVKRLAKAQIISAETKVEQTPNIEQKLRQLDEENYVLPGKFWWAFDPENARDFYQDSVAGYGSAITEDIKSDRPSVLLIDEIDKADSELPNALLEVLNNKSFQLPVGDKRIECNEQYPPFIVITSNDERSLPHAFLRRCVCHTLTLGKDKEGGEEQLIKVAQAHQKGNNNLHKINNQIIQKAAQMTIEARERTQEHQYRPGTAEFLDLLKAISHDNYKNDDEREQALDDISTFLLEKA